MSLVEPHNWTALDQVANDPRFTVGLVVFCVAMMIVNYVWDWID